VANHVNHLDGSLDINKLLALLLPNGVTLPANASQALVNTSISLPKKNLTIDLEIKDVAITGLDTFAELQALLPTSKTGLHSSLYLAPQPDKFFNVSLDGIRLAFHHHQGEGQQQGPGHGGEGSSAATAAMRELPAEALAWAYRRLLDLPEAAAAVRRVMSVSGRGGELEELEPKAEEGLDELAALGLELPPFALRLAFQGLRLQTSALAVMDTGVLQSLPVENSSKVSCAVSSLKQWELSHLAVSAANISLELVFPLEETVIYSFNVSVNGTTAGGGVQVLLQVFANTQLREAVRAAPFKCKGQDVPPPPGPSHTIFDTPFAHYFGGIAVCIAVTVAGLCMLHFVWGPSKNRRRAGQGGEGKGSEGEGTGEGLRQQTSYSGTMPEKFAEPLLPRASSRLSRASMLSLGFHMQPLPEPDARANASKPLLFHPGISPWIRYGVPFIILADIVVFVSANSGIGAQVQLQATVNGQSYSPPPLFAFSLGNSVRDMWNAQVYALSLVICVFSGAWTYLKLVLMLYCWVALPTKLLPERSAPLPLPACLPKCLNA
jgi:hypothetical protein